MKKLGLLKFDDLYNIESTLLVHDCVYGKAPQNIRNCINSASNSSLALRTHVNKPLDLRSPLFKTRAGTCSFSCQGPNFWNKVSTEMRSIDQKGRFKKLLKDSILDEYDHKATCTNPRCRDISNHLSTE